jgi:hypothetical protein
VRKIHVAIAAILLGGIGGFQLAQRSAAIEATARPGEGFAVVPGVVGGQDMYGGYNIVKGWPKDISTVPGNEKWTWGAGQSVYAESPDRIFVLQRGELPNIKRPQTKKLDEFGPSILFPIGRLPWRDATVSSPPAAGGTGQDPKDGMRLYYGKLGVDANWENCIVVINSKGDIIERWTQWDKILKRPHFVTINPYDPEKHVWIVDDHMHAIYKFTHDGKQLVQTIVTTARASPNSIRMENSCSHGVRKARHPTRSAPAI